MKKIIPDNKLIILVDENDRELGVIEKLIAHQQGQLHRAFSIFIYRQKNNQYELLLHQRQLNKYHSPGLWTNTCCSHPAPGETIMDAAKRRLKEEMGINTDLAQIGVFHYKAEVGNKLIENEIDHVLVGEISSEEIKADPDEVMDYAWIELDTLSLDLKINPNKYTAWLASALKIFYAFVNNRLLT